MTDAEYISNNQVECVSMVLLKTHLFASPSSEEIEESHHATQNCFRDILSQQASTSLNYTLGMGLNILPKIHAILL